MDLRDQTTEMRIDYIRGFPPNAIAYVAKSNETMIFSHAETGPLLPSQILSIRAFSMFRCAYNIYMERVKIYRKTVLGQFMTMQTKRLFQRSSKALWILRDDKELAIVMQLHELCVQNAVLSGEREVTREQIFTESLYLMNGLNNRKDRCS